MSNKQETNLQNNIRIELSKLGIKTFRNNVGRFKTQDDRWIKIGTVGMSDLLAIKNGKAIWLETKTPVGKASKEQVAFIKAMQLSGCKAGFVRSIEDAIKICSEE